MLIMVIAKPIPFTIVKEVPLVSADEDFAISNENKAESAVAVSPPNKQKD